MMLDALKPNNWNLYPLRAHVWLKKEL
uniref:Uncharacterized protein n=1 Tax=Arundo donax TaxID=35708 RepID=A0A0A9A9F0_ARUDO